MIDLNWLGVKYKSTAQNGSISFENEAKVTKSIINLTLI